MDYSTTALFCMFLACFIVGFSKSSIGGLGIITVPIIIYGFGAKPALGVFLPVLIFADIWSVWLYRGMCNWRVLLRLLPTTMLGVVSGFFFIDMIPDIWFGLIIGVIILGMLSISLYADKFPELGKNKSYSGFIGVIAGLTSIIANSAGSLVGMYFLQQQMKKREFISTRNHFFVLLNVSKFPFIFGLNLITVETLMLDVMFIPAIFIGSWVGFKLINRINLNLFKKVVQVVALVSGVRLVWVGMIDLLI